MASPLMVARIPLGDRNENAIVLEGLRDSPMTLSGNSLMDENPVLAQKYAEHIEATAGGTLAEPATRKRAPKRKSDATDVDPESVAEIIDDDDPRLDVISDTPQQVRRKIRAFIDNGNMKVGEFQRAIGVSPTAYTHFMQCTRSRDGQGSGVYPAAAAFFTKRQLQGLEEVPKQKNKKQKTDSGKKDGAKAKDLVDVEGVELDGEETQKVPVWETCDEVRKKIRALLRRDAGGVLARRECALSA
ncbi:hypothetical protein F5Y15DRAFT_377060 [Xylariaceae sp. FL0016]|nr:hypothetical protein F5Y15DRAFT_377060 [Xylariaceae sp. FL0016]